MCLDRCYCIGDYSKGILRESDVMVFAERSFDASDEGSQSKHTPASCMRGLGVNSIEMNLSSLDASLFVCKK